VSRVKQKFSSILAGLKSFVVRRGVVCVVVTCLFVLLLMANAVYGVWELSYNPKFCTLCHNIRPYVDSYYASEHTDHIHYQANVVCKECHVVSPVESLGEAWAYVTGNYDNPLSERRLGQENCLRCHRSYESLIEKTSHLERNPHDGHWPEMECNLCHKAHRSSVDYCAQCHESGHEVQP